MEKDIKLEALSATARAYFDRGVYVQYDQLFLNRSGSVREERRQKGMPPEYGNRRNTFGSLHNCDPGLTWIGPSAWYPSGDRFSYDYRLLDMGVMTSPMISVFCK